MTKEQRNTKPLITSRFERWQDQLSQPIQQSIKFFSDPKNITHQNGEKPLSWVVAGISDKKIHAFRQQATRLGVKNSAKRLNNEGFERRSRTSVYQPDQRSQFLRLKASAQKLGLNYGRKYDRRMSAMAPSIPTRLPREHLTQTSMTLRQQRM